MPVLKDDGQLAEVAAAHVQHLRVNGTASGSSIEMTTDGDYQSEEYRTAQDPEGTRTTDKWGGDPLDLHATQSDQGASQTSFRARRQEPNEVIMLSASVHMLHVEHIFRIPNRSLRSCAHVLSCNIAKTSVTGLQDRTLVQEPSDLKRGLLGGPG